MRSIFLKHDCCDVALWNLSMGLMSFRKSSLLIQPIFSSLYLPCLLSAPCMPAWSSSQKDQLRLQETSTPSYLRGSGWGAVECKFRKREKTQMAFTFQVNSPVSKIKWNKKCTKYLPLFRNSKIEWVQGLSFQETFPSCHMRVDSLQG